MYDPTIARFLQEDTYTGSTVDPLSLNLYTYCHNEPLRYIDPSGHSDITDYMYLPNDAILQIEKYTMDYNYPAGGASTMPANYAKSRIEEIKRVAHQNAEAVRTYYALYYPKDSALFKKYYKKGVTKDGGFVVMPKNINASRLITLPNGKEVTAEVAATDPYVRKYFFDNYTGNQLLNPNSLFTSWRHDFYGYTADEIKNQKFSDGLEQATFGTIQTAGGALTVIYTGGLAAVAGGASALDGLSTTLGGISRMINAGNDKGETWNFKRNLYNLISPEYGDKIYQVDQAAGVLMGLYGMASSATGKTGLEALKGFNWKSRKGAVIIPGPKGTPKTWTSADKYVGETANAIEAKYPGKVVDINKITHRPDGTILTDFDIELNNTVIQVKAGTAKGLTSQITKTATGTAKEVIGYAPNLNPSSALVKNANKQGIKVFTSLDDLLNYLNK
jgi:hypothetical protein